MPKIPVVKSTKAVKSSGRKVAKAPAKKAVKVTSKKSTPVVKARAKRAPKATAAPSLEGLESMIESLGGESSDGQTIASSECGDSLLGAGDHTPETNTQPVTITSEETVIGDEPGDTTSEILAASDEDECDDADDEDFDDELDEELDSDDDDEDDTCNE